MTAEEIYILMCESTLERTKEYIQRKRRDLQRARDDCDEAESTYRRQERELSQLRDQWVRRAA